MSGMAVVVEKVGGESVAKRGAETSRQLYAKKVGPKKEPPSEPKQKDDTASLQSQREGVPAARQMKTCPQLDQCVYCLHDKNSTAYSEIRYS